MPPPSVGKARLNPFIFPAETDVRFTLLVIAGCMLAVNISLFFPYIFIPDRTVASSLPDALPSVDALPPVEYLEQTRAANLTWALEALRMLALPVALVVALFLLALIIYRAHPAFIRRKRKLKPLAPGKDQTFYQEVYRLAGLAGIAPPPVIELGQGLHLQNGQAFGFPKRYMLRLDGGLRLLLRKAPSTFRAIVLHELAHIANRDVARTYFAQSLWVAVVSLAIVPLVVAIAYIIIDTWFLKLLAEGVSGFDWRRLFTVSIPSVLSLIFRIGATLLLVAAIRAGLLRVREIYADCRAAMWGAEDSLAQILVAQAAKEEAMPRRKASPWRLHPTARERLVALKEPARLFRMTWDLPFIVGALSAFVIDGMIYILLHVAMGATSALFAAVIDLANLGMNQSGSGGLLSITSVYQIILVSIAILIALLIALITIPFLIVAYFVSGTVGLQVQRETIAEMAVRQNPAGYWRLCMAAALVVLGLEAGFLLTPVGTLSPRSLMSALLILPWLAGAIIVTWLCLAYIRFFSKRWLGLHRGATPPRWKRRFLTLTFSGLLWAFYLPLLISRHLIVYPTLEATAVELGQKFFSVTLITGLLLYLLVFGACWMLVQIERLIRTTRCPSCRQITKQQGAVGQACEHCCQNLSAWLFTAPPLIQRHHP